MTRITMYVDKVANDITDSKEIAKMIKVSISHLGKFEIYYANIDNPKTFLKKLWKAFTW